MSIKQLNEPIPYKWRLQSAKNGRATIVAYIDARQVQDALDSAVGAENWASDFKSINDQLFGGIGIRFEDGKWVWKWDTGTESNQDKEKGLVSDAFKRAAVQWGVGRFLYELGVITLKTKMHSNNKEYPTTSSGEILWSKEELTEYCEGLVSKGIMDDTKPKNAPAVEAPEAKKWITDAQVEAAIKRIEAGEEGVIEKIKAAFRVSKANKAKLEAAGAPDDSTTEAPEADERKVKAQAWFAKYDTPTEWVRVKAYAKKVLSKEAGAAGFKAKGSEELVEVLSIEDLVTLQKAIAAEGK